MKSDILTFIAIFVTLLILDYIWLGIITKKFIISEFSSLIKVENDRIKINLIAGILAWIAISIGVFVFVVEPTQSYKYALIYGALFGFITYSIYDLTNLAFITNYPLKFTIIDILWGSVLCSIISTVGFLVKSTF